MNTRRIELPLRTVSSLNQREHWSKRARRTKTQRTVARLKTESELRPVRRWFVPTTVKLTRVAPGKLDGDNLQGALKAVRDGIADALGIDDGDDSVTWTYDQQRGRARQYAVIVELFE